MDESGDVVAAVEASSLPARVAVTREHVETVQVGGQQVPVYGTRKGEVENLPAPQDGTVFLVSRLVVDALPDRTDLVAPDELVRDADGQVVGARALAR